MLEIVATVGSSGVVPLREEAHAGDAVHLTRVLAVGLEPMPLPRPVAQTLQHPAPLHGVTHHRRCPFDGDGSRSGRPPTDVRVVAQPADPTSMPGQALGRRPRRLLAAQRPRRFHHQLGGAGQRCVGALLIHACARQHVAGRVFLAPPQLEEGLRPEAEGAHGAA
jgi:hypothetical protein